MRTGPGSNGALVVGGGSAGLVPAAVLGAGGLDDGGSGDPDVVAGELSGSDVTGADEVDAGGPDDAGLVEEDDAVGDADPEGDVGESVGVGSAVVDSPTTT